MGLNNTKLKITESQDALTKRFDDLEHMLRALAKHQGFLHMPESLPKISKTGGGQVDCKLAAEMVVPGNPQRAATDEDVLLCQAVDVAAYVPLQELGACLDRLQKEVDTAKEL